MTATTAQRGYHYPEGTDYLADTAAAIQQLATDLDGDVAGLDSRLDGLELRVAGTRYLSATGQVLANATWTRLTMNASDSALAGLTVSGAGLTVVQAGLYAILGQVQWAISALGHRGLVLTRNHPAGPIQGNYLAAQANAHPVQSAGQQTLQQINGLLPLAAGDLVELWGYQSSGGNLSAESVSAGGSPWAATFLSVARVAL